MKRLIRILQRKLDRYEEQIQRKERLRKQRTKEERQIQILEQAQNVIRACTEKTQKQLEFHLSDLVSNALSSVLDSPYKLILDFNQKKNHTEANLFLENRSGEKITPIDNLGGGVVDITSIALQVSLWSMGNPRLSPILLLDEPLRFLKGESMPRKGAALLKKISEELGIQILLISHQEEQIESADRVFQIKKHKTISTVKELKTP